MENFAIIAFLILTAMGWVGVLALIVGSRAVLMGFIRAAQPETYAEMHKRVVAQGIQIEFLQQEIAQVRHKNRSYDGRIAALTKHRRNGEEVF